MLDDGSIDNIFDTGFTNRADIISRKGDWQMNDALKIENNDFLRLFSIISHGGKRKEHTKHYRLSR